MTTLGELKKIEDDLKKSSRNMRAKLKKIELIRNMLIVYAESAYTVDCANGNSCASQIGMKEEKMIIEMSVSDAEKYLNERGFF